MNELVYLKNDEAVCDSLQVAERFEKRHADVIRAIENLIKNDSTQNCVQCFKQSFYKDETGKKNKMYLMTVMVLPSWSWASLATKQRVEMAVHQSFNQMENIIYEKSTQTWIETRAAGKLTRKVETDTIKKLVDMQRDRAVYTAEMLYMTYSKLANKNGRNRETG